MLPFLATCSDDTILNRGTWKVSIGCTLQDLQYSSSCFLHSLCTWIKYIININFTSSVALLLNLSVIFLVYCAALSNVSWLLIFSMMLSSSLTFSKNSRSICFRRAVISLSFSVTSWFGGKYMLAQWSNNKLNIHCTFTNTCYKVQIFLHVSLAYRKSLW